MEEPDSDLTAADDERVEAPDFDSLMPSEELVSGERTRDDFLDAVLGLNEPATAREVADLAGHGVDAAREYLAWFERMGIVTRVTESPATYERNQAYLTWRRVQRLREAYTPEELLGFLETATERAETLQQEFDAGSPDAVSISAHAAATDQSVEAVWERLSAWRTARRRVQLLERALSTEAGDVADSLSAV